MYHETYDDLNKAKKQILYLMKLKYEEDNEDDDYNDTDDVNSEKGMESILKSIDNAISYINNMIPLTKRSTGAQSAHPFFRTQQTYISFVNLSLNLENTLKSINKTFKIIINNIGFVEPEDIDTFKDQYKTLINDHFDLVENNSNSNTQVIEFKIIGSTDTDLTILHERFNNIQNEITSLFNYNKSISQNYNYKSSNVKSKPKTINFMSSKQSNNDIDDDDE
jgi:hypothetical protein